MRKDRRYGVLGGLNVKHASLSLARVTFNTHHLLELVILTSHRRSDCTAAVLAEASPVAPAASLRTPLEASDPSRRPLAEERSVAPAGPRARSALGGGALVSVSSSLGDDAKQSTHCQQPRMGETTKSAYPMRLSMDLWQSSRSQ